MSEHKYLNGMIYHKRFSPKQHFFKYKFFMLDLDLNSLETLSNNSLFSYNKFNLFSLFAKDHFGKSKDFRKNVESLIEKYQMKSTSTIRFITLPRIMGFVFNPISVLLLIEDEKPKQMLVEVHNYNGGRVVYPVDLKTTNNRLYFGTTQKDMYVSPFFKRDGKYSFTLNYTKEDFQLNIMLYEENEKVLLSNLKATSIKFSKENTIKLFLEHTLLTVWVVTRTIYQSLKLKFKGLKWNKPIKQDQIRRV